MLYTKQALAILAFVPFALLAQKDVVSAYNANQDGDYLKAAEYIDKAIENPKANIKAKTWHYRGDIYTNLAADSASYAVYPDAFQRVLESYAKSEELDLKNRFLEDRFKQLERAALVAQLLAGEFYEQEDYQNAGNHFLYAVDLAKGASIPDTSLSSLRLNAAVCFMNGENYLNAIDQYLICGAKGYGVPDVFTSASRAALLISDTTKALEILTNARMDYPSDQGLIIEELNIYLARGAMGQALQNLRLAAERDSQNTSIWMALGNVLDGLSKTKAEEATAKEDAEIQAESEMLRQQSIDAYKTCISIEPSHFEANFNLGALYFNTGGDMKNKSNGFPLKMTKAQQAEFDALLEESIENFKIAMTYMEVAYSAQSADLVTVSTLRDLYLRLNMEDKRVAIQEVLDGLQNEN